MKYLCKLKEIDKDVEITWGVQTTYGFFATLTDREKIIFESIIGLLHKYTAEFMPFVSPSGKEPSKLFSVLELIADNHDKPEFLQAVEGLVIIMIEGRPKEDT